MQMQPELRSLHSNQAFTEREWMAIHSSIDGIPLLMPDPPGYIGELGSEWNASLDELPFHALAHLARYVPQLCDASAPIRRALAAILDEQLEDTVELAIEAGCSVGADLHTLGGISKRVIGFDSYITPLRVAQRLIDGKSITVPLRDEGRGFSFEASPIKAPKLENVTLVCGDALDPPFLPECADLIVAMNLLDNVSSPLNLLAQMDAILKPGGLLIISSPFNWNDAITPPNQQLAGSLDPSFDGMDTALALSRIMSGESPYHPHLRYEVVDTQDVDWRVREHSRCSVLYRVFLCALRKRA